MRGKRCVKCDATIPPEDVQLAPDEDERCHDCADYCDDPDCAKCADNAVRCSVCGAACAAQTAHLHQGKWIGDECCWDERLRSSE
jgi:hypothetical protein